MPDGIDFPPIRRRGEGDRKRDRSYPPSPEALTVGVYDNHTHLEIADAPEGEEVLSYQEQLDRASSVGVRGVVQVGTDLATSRWSAAVAAVEPRVLAAVALHPNEAPDLAAAGTLDDQLAEIDALAAGPRVRAVGETGLDFFRTEGEEGRRAQFASFEAHIEIAKRHGLALQIHDRDAHDDVVATLRRVGAPEKVVFHCFSGDEVLAATAAAEGWFCSFAGTVTFGNARRLRDALQVVPRHLLLVETDAPFLTPTPFRGRPNAPYLIPHTVRGMAEALDTDVALLAAQLSSNTELVYGSWATDLASPDQQTDAPRPADLA